MSCRVTAAVAGGGDPCGPAPDEAAGENTPARHAHAAPAATTATMPTATQRRWPREPLATPDPSTSAWCPASRVRGTVPLMTRLLAPPAQRPAARRPPARRRAGRTD